VSLKNVRAIDSIDTKAKNNPRIFLIQEQNELLKYILLGNTTRGRLLLSSRDNLAFLLTH